jgi:translin
MGDIDDRVDEIAERLRDANRAREAGLIACRAVIRASGSAVRAVHLEQPEVVRDRLAAAESALREAQSALAPFPNLVYAGFLHDAAKEYVEARATAAFVDGGAVPSPSELGVDDPAWLNGLAEAASELRRHALDRLRAGELARAEALLGRMDNVFGALVSIDEPDALTGGLRRTLDALRAVIERTRGDVTSAVIAERLQRSIEGRLGSAPPSGV